MTNKEVIEQLKLMKVFIGYDTENPLVKKMQSALDMAIKALEQQPCEDCISRAEALIAIEKEKQGWESEEVRYAIDGCYEMIVELPSVDDITAWMPLSEFIEKLRDKK